MSREKSSGLGSTARVSPDPQTARTSNRYSGDFMDMAGQGQAAGGGRFLQFTRGTQKREQARGQPRQAPTRPSKDPTPERKRLPSAKAENSRLKKPHSVALRGRNAGSAEAFSADSHCD